MLHYRINKLFDDEQTQHQKCSECGVDKPLFVFHTRDKRKRIDTRCKPCKHIIDGLVRKFKKEYIQRNTGRCECCDKYKGKEKLRCDHDHKTNEFRGWLCENCNHGIGKLGDNLDGLMNAVEYLKRNHSGG
jgi:hypothetical protein